MIKKTALLFGILGLICSSAVFAALSHSSGPYVEGDLGIANQGRVVGIVNGGYKFNSNIAVEASYMHIGDNYLGINLKTMMPFNNGFDLFAKIGPTLRGISADNLEIFTGTGGSYAFTPNISGNMQVFWVSGGEVGATLGLSYIF